MTMTLLFLLLYLLASVCFIAYAIGGIAPRRLSLLGLGVFFWSLVPLIQTIQKL